MVAQHARDIMRGTSKTPAPRNTRRARRVGYTGAEIDRLTDPERYELEGRRIDFAPLTRRALEEIERAWLTRGPIVVRAGQRIGGDGEHVDEGELGLVFAVQPAELFASSEEEEELFAGGLALHVHLRETHTSKVWIWLEGTRIELAIPKH